MICRQVIPSKDVETVKSWLTENLGEENVRWWAEKSRSSEWVSTGKNIGYRWDYAFYIDPTEEEEPLLTMFLLKWR